MKAKAKPKTRQALYAAAQNYQIIIRIEPNAFGRLLLNQETAGRFAKKAARTAHAYSRVLLH